MVFLSHKDRFRYEESVRVQKALNHPLIVGIIDDFTDSEGYICVVKEFYREGDFRRYLRASEGNIFTE